MTKIDRFRWVVWLFIVLMICAGCSSTSSLGKKSRANSLDLAADSYRKLIRWGYFDEAAKYLRAKDGSVTAPDLDTTARYRVTAYAIRSQLAADTGDEARVLAVIEYYEIDSGVINLLTDEQLWWYESETERWYLESGLPAFGTSKGKRPAALPLQ